MFERFRSRSLVHIRNRAKRAEETICIALKDDSVHAPRWKSGAQDQVLPIYEFPADYYIDIFESSTN